MQNVTFVNFHMKSLIQSLKLQVVVYNEKVFDEEEVIDDTMMSYFGIIKHNKLLVPKIPQLRDGRFENSPEKKKQKTNS